MTRIAIVPIRDFSGMTRLSPLFSDDERRATAISLATRVGEACARAGTSVAVLSADDEVRAWATSHAWRTIEDHGHDLSTAVHYAVTAIDDPWMVVHADLPLVDPDALLRVARAADVAGTSLSPSLDGGTNVIASTGEFPFAFGPDSFTAHLAARPSASVLVDRQLALELDTPSHALALRRTGLMPSLLV